MVVVWGCGGDPPRAIVMHVVCIWVNTYASEYARCDVCSVVGGGPVSECDVCLKRPCEHS